MEYVVIASIVSLGYLLSNKKINDRNIVENKVISENKLPNNNYQTQENEKI